MEQPAYVGRFEVLDEIARGGFATVLRAWDDELQSLVAIKILHADLARDARLKDGFVEEARLVRRIRSPHVITVHDVGRLGDGRPYFVMEFAEGGTLAARISSSAARLTTDSHGLALIADAIADGLAAVHDAGVVHRDVKPANVLFHVALRRRVETAEADEGEEPPPTLLVRPNERIALSDFGIAKSAHELVAGDAVHGATPLYEAPEQLDPTASITPATDIYSATATLWQVVVRRRPPAAAEVAERAIELPAGWRDVVARGMATDPNERFPTIDAWRDAVHEAIADESDPGSELERTRTPPRTARCPYKGLAAYQPEDAAYFAGREVLIDELVRRLRESRVLVVGGPSGSGKSSVVRAGLVPALRAGALPGSERWHIALFTPGRDPIAGLYFHLVDHDGGGATPIPLSDFVARPTLARHLAHGGESREPVVLCVDQFEECFTLTTPDQRAGFVQALSALTDPADSRVRLVLTVRADFYAACARVPWLAERITQNQVLVGPMTAPELRRAVNEPAHRAGLQLERELIDAIIDEAGAEAGSLPLLGHALVETWRRRRGHVLTLDGFRAAGGVAGAISQTAEAMFDRLTDEERTVTKRLFLRLVTSTDGVLYNRRSIRQTEVEQDAAAEVARRVVDAMTDARLLTVDDETVQIAHEALLRTWPRLREWIDDSRDDLRMRERIAHAAEEWDAEGRETDLLYRGVPLASASEWRARNEAQLGGLERDFLDASLAERDRREAAAAERARRSRRVRRAAAAGLAVLAAGATAASVVAFAALRSAQNNETVARSATAEAREQFASALAAAAANAAPDDPLLALALAVESAHRAESAPFDARAAMIAARHRLMAPGVWLLGAPIHADDAAAIALSPEGDELAAFGRDGRIALHDVSARRRDARYWSGHDGGARDVGFAPDGSRLVTGGADGHVRVWSITDDELELEQEFGVADPMVTGVAVSPDGDWIASAHGDGTARLWNLPEAQGQPIIRLPLGFKTVAFLPDGSAVVAGNDDGTLRAWTLPSLSPLLGPVPYGSDSHPRHMVISGDGSRLAMAATDGTTTMIELPAGRVLGKPSDAVAGVGGLAFSSDGSKLFMGTSAGDVAVWDTRAEKKTATSARGHERAIVDMGLDGEGSLLATLGDDQQIRTWRVSEGTPLGTFFQLPSGAAKGLAATPDGQRIAAGDDSGRVFVWTAGRRPRVLRDHSGEVWALAFAPHGASLASADANGNVVVRHLASAAGPETMAAPDGAIWQLEYSPDGSKLFGAGEAGLLIWDVDGGGAPRVIAGGDRDTTGVAVAPDGRQLATSGADGVLRIWSVESGELVRAIDADDNVLWAVAFGPGGLLAAASSDEVVSIWKASTGDEIAALGGHFGGATDVAFLDDGSTIVAVDRRGNVHFWDVASGRRLHRSEAAHEGSAWQAVPVRDGRFVTAGDDGTVKLWDMLSVERACAMSEGAFDAVRRRQYLGDEDVPVGCDVDHRAPNDAPGRGS
ncbi:MAG: serine/threonine-protein kinase [Pseudomonadota bacterium]